MPNHRPRPSAEFITPEMAKGHERIILRLLYSLPEGATRNEIALMTGLRLQGVCGRVGELLTAGAVLRGPLRPCTVTGKNNETIHARRGQSRLWGLGLEPPEKGGMTT